MNFKTLLRGLAACAIAAFAASSCSTHRSPLPYFTDIDSLVVTKTVMESPVAYAPKIQPDDELYIMVTSFNNAATGAYNLPMTNPATAQMGVQATSPQIQTYLVDSKGDINMPILGRVHVAGLTTEQIRQKITDLIKPDVEDPNVIVRLMNFKVDVAGEVKKPGLQIVATDRYTVLDALTAAGDLTEFGERNNVLLIRETDGKRIAHRFDLNKSEMLSDPYFYLQPNDYLYVQPNKIRQDNSKYNQNNAYKVSVVSAIVSGASVITSLVIALTIK